MTRSLVLRCAFALATTALALSSLPTPLPAAEPVKIGLVATLSGPSALSGEAITHGLGVAIDEINAAGGVLGGRKLELVRRDDEANPGKGQLAARELIEKEHVAAVFGGIESPVSLAMVSVVQELKVPYMGVWAAATGITRNGNSPNYCFRVSAVDDIVDKALVEYAKQTYKTKKPGAILINNPWGASNQKGFEKHVPAAGITLAGIEKFSDEDLDVTPQLGRLKAAGADTLFLVANAAPGAQVMKSLQRMGWKVPVVSHWGISGGRFYELAGASSADVAFVQTYSFFGKQSPVAQRVIKALQAKYPAIKGPGDVLSPVGTADSYDAMMLVGMAIKKAGSTEGEKIRVALENLGSFDGLIKHYDRPFTADNHDALNERDYVMVRWEGSKIVPVAQH